MNNKHLKWYNTQGDFDSGSKNLRFPWVSVIEDENTGELTIIYNLLNVKDCIDLEYFNEQNNVIKPSDIPYNIKDIDDFAGVFFGNKNLDGQEITSDYAILSLENDTTLTQAQKEEIIDIVNSTTIERNLWHLNFRGINMPEKDIVLTRYGNPLTDEFSHEAAHDLFRDSTFNSVTIINKRGNISSMNSLFRGANVKKIIFVRDGGKFSPTDMAGMCEWNGIMTEFPNTIDYSYNTNIGYTWECCYALKEIPSHVSVTTEEERVSKIQNIIGANYGLGFAEQAFNACTNLEKIGPVIDCKTLVPNDSGQPYKMFNGCNKLSNLRVKNLNNGNWNFENVFNMDIDSIKYAIDNAVSQPESTWVNMKPSTVIGNKVSFSTSDNTLLFKWPTFSNRSNTYFTLAAKKFLVNVPSGYTLKIYAYDSGQKYIEDTLTVSGNGSEKEVAFANGASVYPYLVLSKNDGSSITPASISNLTISIKYSNSDTYSGNVVPNNTHKLTFSGRYADKISDKSIIDANTIEAFNNKGWQLYTDVFEVTPSTEKFNLAYRFNFETDWELNPAYANDVEVSESQITIKKFRPNMWILKSKEALNSTNLSGKFAGIRINLNGMNAHSSKFSSGYYANGAVGGDGGTKGQIRGLGILPFSLHNTPNYYYAPELPYSAYVWDSATKADGSGGVQVASELTAWRGDWGAGYNGYGFVNNLGKRLVYPNITTFPTPYNNYNLAIGLYTGNVHTFDRWWADNDTLKSYLSFQGPYKVTMRGRFKRYSIPTQTTTLTSGYTLLNNGQLSENADFSVSDFIPINNVTQVKWKNQGSGLICEYDANKNIIDYWNPNGNPRTVTLTGGSNTKYIRISMKTSEINNVYLTGENTQEFIYKGNNVTDMTINSGKMLATQEVFSNVKFKFSGMLENDYIKWSHTSSTIKDESGNTITEITKDGIYTVSNSGLDGGFILYGDSALNGTNPITVEILGNPSYVDSDGYIDISDSPIVIDLIYDQITA